LKIVHNENILDTFKVLRSQTEQLISRLSEEDQCVQSMPDASPIKWHLGHTTWFFETLILIPHCAGYSKFSVEFTYFFSSYYESVGPLQPRPHGRLITMPSLSEVMAYRAHVSSAMKSWMEQSNAFEEIVDLIVLGIHHEQQHQELMATDALHFFSCHPFLPDSHLNFSNDPGPATQDATPKWVQFESGLSEFGHALEEQFVFAFDNKQPRHKRWLDTFGGSEMCEMQGSAWPWTRSAYELYPGFRANAGAIREYNGKFMVGQQVLRDSSWAMPNGHARKTYRNFFPPPVRWQISGLRLARDYN
jgi:DinB superfamily